MAVDRKQQMKEITERLEQGVKDIFTSEMYTTYLRTMAKFHNYSFNNTLLIAIAINTSSREKPCSFTGILLFLLADKAGVFPTAKPPATTRPLSF